MKARLMRVFLIALFFAVLTFPAYAQEKEAAPAAAAPPACKAVATIYGKDICEADITISEKAHDNLEAYASKNGQDADKTALNIQHANLFAKVWEIGLIQKFGADVIEPTEKEIAAYLKLQRGAMKQQYGFDKDLAALVKEQLGKYEYPQDVQQKLGRLGAEKQKAIAMYEKRKDVPADVSAKIEEGENKMAYAIVKGWKVKKILYDTYGGRVAFVQTEMEPVDAYKRFLAEIMKDNNAVIHDSKYKNVFTTMQNYIENTKNFIPDDAPEIKDYFAAPGWIYSADMGKKIFEKVKESILAMPEAGIAKPIGTAKAAEDKEAPAAPKEEGKKE